jgi:TRAP-type C4-dicarboxylate transport system permease small subunit
MFALCGVLAKAYSQENSTSKMPSILSLLFISSILLMGIGGVQFVVKNEALKLNGKDDRIRRFYIYFVFTLVGVFIAFAAVFAILNMK